MGTENEKTAKLVSMSGSPIYQHDEAAPWAPPAGEEFIEEISAHITRHLGPVESVFHELVSDIVHIDVHFVKPTAQSPNVRLVTSGMSDLPMSTPEGANLPRHMELMITLPGDWKLDQESLKDDTWYWPVYLLKSLARLPHKYRTWLGFGHTVPNGDPPAAFWGTDGLDTILFMLPIVNKDSNLSEELTLDGDGVHCLWVVPLTTAERHFKLKHGFGR